MAGSSFSCERLALSIWKMTREIPPSAWAVQVHEGAKAMHFAPDNGYYEGQAQGVSLHK